MAQVPASGVLDLLGALAYGELTAFERMADDAKLAPTLADKAELAGLSVVEFGHYARLRDRISELGGDAVTVMKPFRAAVDSFHAHTAPRDWIEGVVKAYVGDGIAADFYREASVYVDDRTRSVMLEALSETGYSDFAVRRVRDAIAADPKVAGRLALWGRRLVGEALSQAQRVAAERDLLSALLVGATDQQELDLATVGQMFTRLTDQHVLRMSTLDLQS
jgi:tRNA-(MS[2]IO[6]A)-hydroxylase (MiaE)-like